MLCAIGPAAAQDDFLKTKLTDFQTPKGAVEKVQVSGDGSRVVYTASQNLAGMVELFSVPVGGGVVTQLSQPMVPGGDVYNFVISPDSGHVVFRADAEVDEQIELFRVPITGGSVVQMNGPLVPSGDVELFAVSPDSAHVVYSANQVHFQTIELFSHAVSSGVVTQLSAAPSVGQDIRDFKIAPDSSAVAFRQGAGSSPTLYSSPIGGGGAATLAANSWQYLFTSDSLEIFFVADVSAERPILRIPVAGGVATPVGPADVDVTASVPLVLTSDDSTLLFFGDVGAVTTEVWALDVGTSATVNLSGSLLSPSDEVFLSPDETTVVFGNNLSGGSNDESLVLVPITGGAPVELWDEGHNVDDVRWSADGSRLFFRRDGLYAVPADGSAPPTRLDPGSGESNVRSAVFTANDLDVLYSSNHSGIYELYTVPWSGGASTRLSDPQASGKSINGEILDGDKAFYWGEQELINLTELYQVPTAGGGTTKLNAPMLGTGGRTHQAVLSPDGTSVAFAANQRFGRPVELWGYSVTEGGAPVLLSESLEQDFRPSIRFGAGGSRIVFRAPVGEDDFGLFSVPAGGGAVLRLDDPADGTVARGWDLSSDGQWAIYTARVSLAVPRTVHRVAVTGGAVRFLFEEGSEIEYALSADGQRMVYRSSDDRLMSVPLAAGSAVELAAAGVGSFRISADSARVVYWLPIGFGELYTVPIAGGAAIRLNEPSWPCPGSGSNFTLSSDGARVLFFCAGLYSVPILGGTAELAADLNGTWTDSPDGSRIIGTREDNHEVVAAPIAGGPEQVLMSLPTMPLHVYVEGMSPRFAADSDRMFWLAADGAPGTLDLFTAPFGGATTKVNADGTTNVESYAFSDDGERIFFIETPLTAPLASPVKSELVSRAVSGGEEVRYTATMPRGGHATYFGNRGDSLVYVADEEQDETFDLFLVRSSGLFADGFESGDLAGWDQVSP